MTVHKHMLAAGTSHATPYYIVPGSQNGPVLMIVAGIHGNETASIQAAHRLVKQLRKGQLRIAKGKLIIVPIANPRAYRKRIRGVPDLNRTFPKGPERSATHPLSKAIFQLMQTYKPSWYLDLHEANGLSKYDAKVLGQTLVTDASNPAVPAARRAIKRLNRSLVSPSHQFHLRLHPLQGSSRTAAARLIHARTVTVETCWSLPFHVRQSYQMQTIKHFLREAGLV